MHNVELELDHDNFYCPVTGQYIMGDGVIEGFSPSEAVLFCYLNEIGDFEYTKPGIKDLFENCLKETEDDELEAYDLMIQKINETESKNLVCFEITTSGMACGPMSTTLKVCFDMNYRKVINE
jgi:hypothetical protein